MHLWKEWESVMEDAWLMEDVKLVLAGRRKSAQAAGS